MMKFSPQTLALSGFLVLMSSLGMYFSSQGKPVPGQIVVGFLVGLAIILFYGLKAMGFSLEEGKDQIDIAAEAEAELKVKKMKKQRKYEKKIETNLKLEQDKENERKAREEIKRAAKKQLKQMEKRAQEEAAAKIAAQAQVEADTVAEPTKKKKKKKKKKKDEASAAHLPAAETTEEAADRHTEENSWTNIPIKSEYLAAKKAAKGITADVEEEENEEYTEIDPKHFSTILGHEASTIKTLQMHFGVKINLPKKGGMHTATCISGSPEKIEAAKACIQDLIRDGYSMALMGEDATKVSLEVKQLSAIIGPKGAHISTLRSKTGTHIILPPREAESKVVTVIGQPQAVDLCIAAISSLVRVGYSDLTHDNYTSQTLSFPASMLSVLLGTKGDKIKKLQSDTGCRINISKQAEGEGVIQQPVTITIIGPSDGVMRAREHIVLIQTDFTSKEVDFPGYLVNLILGEKGANINMLQKKTNTRINVKPHFWDPQSRSITIEGFTNDITGVETELLRILQENKKVELEYPAARINHLFNNKGEYMKKVQSTLNVRIQVNEHDWDDTYKELSISGPIHNVDKVALELQEIATRPRVRPQKKEQNNTPAVQAAA